MHLLQSSPSTTYVLLIRRLLIKAIYGGAALYSVLPSLLFSTDMCATGKCDGYAEL
jgi:hypothetical protein